MLQRLKFMRGSMRLFRIGMPCLITVFCLWLVAHHIDINILKSLPAEIAQLPILHLFGAACFSVISLWAVGRYDGVAHRHLQTGIAIRPARTTGSIAIALSQTLGFGLFTGAIARWRMLPSLNFTDALRLSAFVCVSFLASWACITAIACLVLPAPHWATLPAMIVILLIPLLLCALIYVPHVTFTGHRLRLPSLLACAAILLWAVIDLCAAALALYFLIPADNLGFATLLPVFLLALGAALLSGTPGGVGPFELILLTLVPQVPPTDLLIGIVSFRAVYYAVPAVLAMLAMLRPFQTMQRRTPPGVTPIADSSRAEIGVIRQNGGGLLSFGSGAVATWPTPQTLTALGDPISAPAAEAVTALALRAKALSRIACFYKCSVKTGLAARQNGWAVLHYADEAVLNPTRFNLASSTRRTLRRKLRQAEQAGVSTTLAHHLPVKEMAAIDQDWQMVNGPARGGTMGRFCPEYIAEQMVFLAYHQNRLVGFVSFHQTDHQWCLDLMRSTSDAPSGTMHALIVQALQHAKAQKVPALSLAATPACPDPSSRLMRAFAVQVVAKSGGPGLRQFKSCFAPAWQPLYMATPSRVGMALALADIALAVHLPPPLTYPRKIHNQDEDNEVALAMAS
ncbi:MAG: phosphatidylglycerol lysyltransferase domain-containing protein [Sulfitobacter sp.]